MSRTANTARLTEEQRRLAEAHMPLAIAEATRAKHLPLDTQERISAALEGVCKAARTFKTGQNVKFATYATYVIRQSMSRAGVNEGHLIRVPEHLRGARRGRANPACAAAAERVMTAGKVPLASWDVQAESPSPSEQIEADEDQARMWAAIEHLPPTAREVIKDRLAGLSATRSAARLGLTTQLLAHHLNRGIALLREALNMGDAA